MTLEGITAARSWAVGLLRHLNIQNFEVNEHGQVTATMPVTKEILNPQGVAHGGAVFALCDSAAGAQAAQSKHNLVTQEGSIHYFRPAMPDTMLTATASLRNGGKTVAVVMVEVTDDQGRHIADATFSMFYKE